MRKKMGITGIIMMMVVTLILTLTQACTSTPTWNQGQAEAVAQTLGAGAVMALNAKGDILKPQEKQAALAAVAALGALGSTGATIPDQAMIDKLIAEKIKDPEQAAAAKTMATSFMAMISPQITNAINSAGTSGAAKVFMAFCKGLGSVPIK